MNDTTTTEPAIDPSTGKPFDDDDTVHVRASSEVRRAVRKVAERQSPGSFTNKPLYKGDPWPNRVPTATAQLQALVTLRGHLDNAIYFAAREARGEGTTWKELAQLLDITDSDGVSAAEAAWDSLVESSRPGGHNWGLTRPYFGYTCVSCQKSITDYGPFESHPEDNERGHAEDCARFRAELAAWRAAHPD